MAATLAVFYFQICGENILFPFFLKLHHRIYFTLLSILSGYCDLHMIDHENRMPTIPSDRASGSADVESRQEGGPSVQSTRAVRPTVIAPEVRSWRPAGRADLERRIVVQLDAGIPPR